MTLNNGKEFRLFHWNANGLSNTSNIKQLEYLLDKENIHVASLNETFFKENHTPYFNKYIIYRRDRTCSRGGGVALLVLRNLQHKLLPIIKTTTIENLSVEVIINNKKFVIITAYSPRYTANFSNDIIELTATNEDYILLGDLNAKHSAWNCPVNNTSGTILNNLQQRCNFFVFSPDKYTLYPHQRNRKPSTVDIALSNSSLNLSLSTLDYEIPSDHLPILCSLNCSSYKTTDIGHFNYKFANWRKFKDIINQNLTLSVQRYHSKLAIDQEVEKFTNLVLNARNSSVPKISPTRDNTLPDDILHYIAERKKFKRKYQRTNNNHLSDYYHQCTQFLTYIINKRITSERNKKWNDLLTGMKTGDKRFWKISRKLRGKGKAQIPYLMHGNTKLISDTEKSEILAETFAKSNKLTSNYSHPSDKRINSIVLNFKLNPIYNGGTSLITINEVKNVLHNLKTSKSPGFDNIPNLLLKQLPEMAIKLLTVIFNSCLHFHYFPAIFKKAKVIPVLKPNKPKNIPSSYRPISLLSNLGKIFEKLIHTRLNDYVCENNLISKEQFGFKRDHSTVHQICRIKNKIMSNRRNRKSTGIILLDIEKAFDTVWHDGLVYKLIKARIPKYLTRLIADFLDNRSFIVSINNTNSSMKNISAGLPQGSILSPLLYSIYTSDFNPTNTFDTAYYADDTALITSSKLTSALLKKMEKSLITCNNYYRKWKIKINNAKTQAIIFPFNKSPKRLPRRNLTINNVTINILDEVKYLGVTLDKKLCFHKHIETTCEKAIKSFRALWPFLNRRSSLNFKNKNLIYKCVIRPILTYASPVWYKAAKSHIKKMQIIQNKCLKMINNKHWRFPTSLLHVETGYEMLLNFIHRLNNKFFTKIENSSYSMIRECREPQ